MRKSLRVMFVLDAILLAGLGIWYSAHALHKPPPPPGAPDIQVEVRQLEPKLSEIDITNHGNAPGPMNKPVRARWSEADLDKAEGLSGFEMKETGRRNVTFTPTGATRQQMLAPAETQRIGWVRLQDDSPVTVEFEDEGQFAGSKSHPG